jgi:RHS repeat-associated protein
METYDAAGTTLVKAYDYLAGMVYQETVVASISAKTLDFIASPEGRAIPKAKVNPADVATTGDQMKFEYSLKDHLGNLRVSCRCGEPKRDAQGVIIPTGQPGAGIDPVAVVQEQHYDAWGLSFSSGTVSSSEVENRKNKFTYNGKELVSDLDLGWNDYGFRMYDASIGRWSAVDPLAEKYHIESPYLYGGNNPILNLDPDGRDYGIYYDHEKKTITVKAEYITRTKDHESALKATGFWNNQSGQYKYVVGSGKDAVAYTVNFDIKVSVDDAPANLLFDGATEKYPSHGAERVQSDETNELNAYDVLPDKSGYFESGDASRVKAGGVTADHVYVSESSRNSNTGAHEVGHTLGTSHDYSGLMSAVNSGGGISANNVGEVLGRAGVGTTRLGSDAGGTGRVNGVTGTAPTGFNGGTVMSNKKYEKMLQKQGN